MPEKRVTRWQNTFYLPRTQVYQQASYTRKLGCRDVRYQSFLIFGSFPTDSSAEGHVLCGPESLLSSLVMAVQVWKVEVRRIGGYEVVRPAFADVQRASGCSRAAKG